MEISMKEALSEDPLVRLSLTPFLVAKGDRKALLSPVAVSMPVWPPLHAHLQACTSVYIHGYCFSHPLLFFQCQLSRRAHLGPEPLTEPLQNPAGPSEKSDGDWQRERELRPSNPASIPQAG